MWSLLLIESTYLACLANTYAVRGKTKVLREGSRLAARPRSLEGTLVCKREKFSIVTRQKYVDRYSKYIVRDNSKNKFFFAFNAEHTCDVSIKTLKDYSKNTLVSILRVTTKEKRKPVIIVKLTRNVTYPRESFI